VASEANLYNNRAASSPLTYEAWKYIPSAYIIALKDKSVPLKQIREVVKEAGIETVLEIDTGHCPYVGQPQTVASFIRKVAGESL
jgi:pimeloyl-ACP methyl ester carboxylesterase